MIMIHVWLLVGMLTILPLCSAGASEPVGRRADAITFKQATHFTSRDGSDIAVQPGTYWINVGDGQRIWLTSETTKETLELSADMTSHDLDLDGDVALLIPGEEDRTHLVVLFQDKTALAAVGFPSAARPRGAGLIRVNPSVLRQNAGIFARPAAPPPQAPPVAAQAPPSTSGKTATKKVDPSQPATVHVGAPQWLTWSYLRMNDPQGLATILRDVQAGKLPPTTLNGLAHPAALTEMMKTNWAAEVARLKALQPKQATDPGSGIRSRGIAGAGGGGFSAVAAIPRFSEAPRPLQQALQSVTVHQAAVDFGGLFYGQVRRSQVDLTVSKDGEIAVEVPSNAALRIISLDSYTGMLRPIFLPPVGSSGLPAMVPGVELVREVDKKRTALPFRLPVRAGQDLSLLVEFAPRKEFSVPEGPFQTAIQIDCTLFEKGQAVPERIVVPVRAQINGLLYGAEANPVTGNSSVLPERDFFVEFEFSNEGQPSEAILEIVNMPLGFVSNVPALRVPLAKGERKNAAFMMRASAAARGPGGSPEEKWITFKFTNGPNTYTIDYPVYLYPTWIRYPFQGTVPFSNGGVLSTQGTLDLRGDGWFNFQGKIDPSTILERLHLGLYDDLYDRWLVGFVLNNGGYKQEITDIGKGWAYQADGMVRELAQDFVRTVDAGFRLLLWGHVEVK
jgi:hypothetical protein